MDAAGMSPEAKDPVVTSKKRNEITIVSSCSGNASPSHYSPRIRKKRKLMRSYGNSYEAEIVREQYMLFKQYQDGKESSSRRCKEYLVKRMIYDILDDMDYSKDVCKSSLSSNHSHKDFRHNDELVKGFNTIAQNASDENNDDHDSMRDAMINMKGCQGERLSSSVIHETNNDKNAEGKSLKEHSFDQDSDTARFSVGCKVCRMNVYHENGYEC